jgi:hypothetical protein
MAYKEIGRPKKKAEQTEKATLLSSEREVRLQGKPLPPILKRQIGECREP